MVYSNWRKRSIDGTMTGIVRLETSTATGIDFARQLADLSSAVLPEFATEWGRDPRAPQNLYPVAQLERELHHRLGDKALIKRAMSPRYGAIMTDQNRRAVGMVLGTESSTPLEWWVASIQMRICNSTMSSRCVPSFPGTSMFRFLAW